MTKTVLAFLCCAAACATAAHAKAPKPERLITCDDLGCSDRAGPSTAAREGAARAPKQVRTAGRARKPWKARRRPPAPQPKAVPAFFRQYGVASFYSGKRSEGGMNTASGVRLNLSALTAAHRTLPFGTRVKVLNVANGRAIVVTVTDRGPFIGGRVIDLTPAGARRLGFAAQGIAAVDLTVVPETVFEGRRAEVPWFDVSVPSSTSKGWASIPAPDLSSAAMDVALRMSAAWFTPGKLFTVRN